MPTLRRTAGRWFGIQTFLPPPVRAGRPRGEDRGAFEDIWGVLYVLIAG